MGRNKPCTKCRDVGRDKTGDHLWLMEDGKTWACFKPYHTPYLERDGGIEVHDVPKFSVNDVKNLPMVANHLRGISQKTMERFKVRTEFNEETGEPYALYYPETYGGGLFRGYKCRVLPKKFITLHRPGHNKQVPEYFGQHCCPSTGKKLLICAGEEDTLAAWEMLATKYPDWDHAVVGLSRSETGTTVVAEQQEFHRGFEEIIIATDMDEAGFKARDKLIPIIGDKARVFDISENDISDMLTKGKQKEFINAYFSAKEYRPSSIISVGDILEEAILPVEWGLSYPWPKLNQLTYGMKDAGEIIGIGAAPGAGKTTLLQAFQQQLIFEHRERIAIFDIEEGATMGLKKLIGSVMNQPIHLPDCEYDMERAREIGNQFKDYAEFYGGDSENWDEVDDAVRYFDSKGIRFFFIDPLSALVEHLSASDGNQELGKIMRAMRKFRKHRGLTFFHANHLNNPSTGKDHGEGGKVRGSQFSGSRAQWKYSTLLMGLQGNQLSEDDNEKHVRILEVLKDRLGGKTGRVHLKYDPATGRLNEDRPPEVL